MTQLLEAVEAVRKSTQEEWESAKAAHEERLGLLDEMVDAAKRLNGGAEAPKASTPTKPKSKAPGPKVSKTRERAQTGHFKPGPPQIEVGRKDAVLDCLRKASPDSLSSKELRAVVGLKSASGIRPLLDQLIEEGKIEKSGQRAGTRYRLANSTPESSSFDPADDDMLVFDFLKGQRQPHSAELITLKCQISLPRVAAALNRLRHGLRIHTVRIGAGNAFEVAGVKAERR